MITDGDLRRLMESAAQLDGLNARDAMTTTPKTISGNMLAKLALELMEAHKITQLIVTDSRQRPVGMVHLHELVKAGFTTSLTLENE